ncbi:hypothetical protein SAMN05660649_02857 [Desulfotomaculum arcticum]|uniref:Uncharacterized protein n=1 Tax=Desulfotruncus arcticus DSM 17038 TaxID=1121424 RepID=A0A1I2V1V0_9FIRM|nr:hypothetical protein SAMN05660649_02857 [Desulfotomaculum arcticum] [Desulfotruncus arcticus DSM 17038]
MKEKREYAGIDYFRGFGRGTYGPSMGCPPCVIISEWLVFNFAMPVRQHYPGGVAGVSRGIL